MDNNQNQFNTDNGFNSDLNNSFVPSGNINNTGVEQPYTSQPVEPTSNKSFIPSMEQINEYQKQTMANKQTQPINLMSNNSTDLYQSGPRVYAVPKQRGNIIAIVILSVIILLAAGYIIFTILSTATKEMVCESSTGNITIKYNKDTVVGYNSNTITYNIYEQREYADQIGIDLYLDEFEKWFKENTQGTCKR